MVINNKIAAVILIVVGAGAFFFGDYHSSQTKQGQTIDLLANLNDENNGVTITKSPVIISQITSLNGVSHPKTGKDTTIQNMPKFQQQNEKCKTILTEASGSIMGKNETDMLVEYLSSLEHRDPVFDKYINCMRTSL